MCFNNRDELKIQKLFQKITKFGLWVTLFGRPSLRHFRFGNAEPALGVTTLVMKQIKSVA